MADRQLTAPPDGPREAALRQDGAGLTDGELLDRFIARRDEAAFEALVRRHGPMVLGVCRRILGNGADAEDAFQATFLVLVRKAASVRPRGMVGNWLYGVARNAARDAKVKDLRRRQNERDAGALSRQAAPDETWAELQAMLDRALPALPDKYRAPIVLCDLEGLTIREAARQLGWPQGTVATRLARGRALLTRRLASSGLSLSVGALALALAQGSASADVPAALVVSTVRAAAAGVVSAPVAALTQGVLKTMLLSKLKAATAVLLGVLACVGGGAVALRAMAARQPEAPAPASKASPDDQRTDKDKLQGKWVAVSAEHQGARVDADDPRLKGMTLTFDGDRVSGPFNKDKDTGQVQHIELSYTLDPTKRPKQIDLELEGKTAKAIYEFEGDKWKWSVLESGERPSGFDTSKTNGTVVVFERKKE